MRTTFVIRPALSFIARFVVALLVITAAPIELSLAAPLTSTTAFPSNSLSLKTNVSYTINFTTATTSLIQQLDFQFATTSGGTTKPANMDLTSTTLFSTSNLGAGWSVDTSSASTGLVKITRASASAVNSAVSATVNFDGITNPMLRDCNAGGIELYENCFVGITTYSDLGVTSVDTGDVAFEITDDPKFSMEVLGTTSGSTYNGITTSVTSTSTGLPFGSIPPNGVRYATHRLNITSNAPRGYEVHVWVETPITGQMTSVQVSPFGAIGATWATPTTWSNPDGTTPGSDTGWLGANTSDTRVSGWASGASKFGPVSAVKRPVANATGPDVGGSTIYVSYALGVNQIHPADIYNGTIVYGASPKY
jgi:hypothetical protein